MDHLKRRANARNAFAFNAKQARGLDHKKGAQALAAR
jgi:hypothetical protein